MKNTELNLIPIFVAIYEEQSLSKAALRLEISQPAVSKALARLRDVYGDPLFNRNTAGVEPTSFAMDIYPALSASFTHFKSTLSSSRDFAPSESKREFSILCLSAIAFHFMPSAFTKMHALAPQVTLNVHPLLSDDYESELRLGKYDLVIDLEPNKRTNLKSEVLFTDSFKACCRIDHPRLLGDEISKQQYLAEEHIAISRGHNRRHILSQLGVETLDKRKVVYSAPGILETIPLVEKTDCIALLPKFLANDLEKKYQIKTFGMPFDIEEVSVSAFWHPSRSADAANRWLREQIRNSAKGLS